LAVVVLILLLAGCATPPKINWASRVGHYSYDQAITELGPPDKSAKLTNGILVGEWLIERGYSRGHYAFFPEAMPYFWSDPPSPDLFLRLTFDANGKLQAWERLSR
jgi:hypothetical protein